MAQPGMAHNSNVHCNNVDHHLLISQRFFFLRLIPKKAESGTEVENYKEVSYMIQTLSLPSLRINFKIESITNDTFRIFCDQNSNFKGKEILFISRK
jgi:hypothetical protein